jgi:hypothetical protein
MKTERRKRASWKRKRKRSMLKRGGEKEREYAESNE